MCPFLAAVIADRLWLYPVGAYCRRPDHPVRVPGAITLARFCTTASHVACDGYRSSVSGCQESGVLPPERTIDDSEGIPPTP